MKGISRFFSVLTYLVMFYTGFTAFVAAFSLANSKFAHFGWMIFGFAFSGFIAAIVLNIFKLKWSSFFVLLGTGAARVYVSYLLIERSGLDMSVFYKQHLPALLVILFALLSTLCFKKYLKNERGITFQKTEKDRLLMEEKQEMAEFSEETAETTDSSEEVAEMADSSEEAAETENE